MPANFSEIFFMNNNNLTFDFQTESTTNHDDKVEFTGYASVFDVIDAHNDVVLQDAFGLIQSSIPLLWQHDMSHPIGKISYIKEDEFGLYIEGFITKKTTKGSEAVSLIEQGVLNSLSIGYKVIDSYTQNDINYLAKLELMEVSLVSIPANSSTMIKFKNDILNKIDKIISVLRR